MPNSVLEIMRFLSLIYKGHWNEKALCFVAFILIDSVFDNKQLMHEWCWVFFLCGQSLEECFSEQWAQKTSSALQLLWWCPKRQHLLHCNTCILSYTLHKETPIFNLSPFLWIAALIKGEHLTIRVFLLFISYEKRNSIGSLDVELPVNEFFSIICAFTYSLLLVSKYEGTENIFILGITVSLP